MAKAIVLNVRKRILQDASEVVDEDEIQSRIEEHY